MFGFPSITVGYTCVSQGPASDIYAKRFVETYERFPPGAPHELVVICNGGKLPVYLQEIFRGRNFGFLERGNEGWDLGGYLELARRTTSKILVCLGESVHFHRAGWLFRIAEAWMRSGAGVYGCFASYLVRPHLNTTAFACNPEFLDSAPRIRTRSDRYEFEHGPQAFWKQVAGWGYSAKLVTWDGEYGPDKWRKADRILWRGDQSNCIVHCHHTERYAKAHPNTRDAWAKGADGLWDFAPGTRILAGTA